MLAYAKLYPLLFTVAKDLPTILFPLERHLAAFMNRIFMPIASTCRLLLHNFQLPIGHACWTLFMLIHILYSFIFLYVLFTMDLTLCCFDFYLLATKDKLIPDNKTTSI